MSDICIQNHHNKVSRLALAALVTAVACLSVGLGGCNPSYRTHGQTNIVGRYSGVELTADLPGTVSVASALAAAEEQFRDQGYSIISNTGTDLGGQVVALAPRSNDAPRATVSVKAGDGNTKVSIWKSPFNEEALCRGILSRMCRKLGL
jgi:hypothetical protein